MKQLEGDARSAYTYEIFLQITAGKGGIDVLTCGCELEEKLGKMQLDFPIGPFAYCLLAALAVPRSTPLCVLLFFVVFALKFGVERGVELF